MKKDLRHVFLAGGCLAATGLLTAGGIAATGSRAEERSLRMTIGINPARVDTLKVPGARLYYEVRGSGPVLLMIPGGPADAGMFAGIAPILADRYTVVTYDPRGNSRSSFDGPPEDWQAEDHADDASRLLSAVGTRPAYVFGSSGGAPVGLALVAPPPQQVR